MTTSIAFSATFVMTDRLLVMDQYVPSVGDIINDARFGVETKRAITATDSRVLSKKGRWYTR